MAATSATVTSKASSASDQVLLAANASRASRQDGPSVIITNDSTAILYIRLGDDAATTSVYSVALAPKGDVGSYYECWGYSGAIHGIWASANGAALVTEFA